jgi:large subunit ribosomal protein L18
MNSKKTSRLRRARKIRARQAGKLVLRVSRSARNITAQVYSEDSSKVLVSASTLSKDINLSGYSGNCDSAAEVGKLVAERALSAGIKEVAFDRSGYKYHGRVKSLAEAARAAGLVF